MKPALAEKSLGVKFMLTRRHTAMQTSRHSFPWWIILHSIPFSQLERYREQVRVYAKPPSVGLRINPEYSEIKTPL